MARAFTNVAARVRCDPGTASASTDADFTWVTAFRMNADSGSTRYAFGFTDGNTYGIRIATGGAVSMRFLGSNYGTSPTVTAAYGPYILIAITYNRTAQTPRIHYYRYDTDTWVRQTGASTGAASGSGAQTTYIGNAATLDAGMSGDIVASATYSRVLGDDETSTLPHSLNSWLSLGPTNMWVLDQSDTGHYVPDLVGGAHELSSGGAFTSVATTSAPIGYGHPVLFGPGQFVGGPTTHDADGTSAGVGGSSAVGDVVPAGQPFITGTPQPFSFTASGTTVTYTGGGVADANTLDVLFINSDNVVTVSGWSTLASSVGGQGAYILTKSGGTSSAVVNLGGGIASNTSVLWVRVANTVGEDTGSTTVSAVNGVSSNTTPALTSGPMATNKNLAFAFAAIHSGTTVTLPSWSTGFTEVTSQQSGSGGTGAYGNVASKSPAGTAAESPTFSWTNQATDRYLLFTSFQGLSAGTTQDASGTSAGTGASSGSATRSVSGDGTATGTGGSSGLLVRASSATSTSSGVAASAGSGARTTEASSTSAGTATSTGSAGRTAVLAGTSAGVASSTADVLGSSSVTGTSSGVGTSSATALRATDLSATSSGAHASTGQLARTAVLVSSFTGTASSSGTATVTSPGSVDGTATGSGSSSGALLFAALATDSSSGLASSSGVLGLVRTTAGTSAGVAASSGVSTGGTLTPLVYRPNSGTVTRPNSGTVVRPVILT